MKKLATTLFGLFLVATSFANVNGNEITLPTNEIILTATTQVTSNTVTVLDQVMDVMILSKKHKPRSKATGGPRVVVETCASKCEDDL